MFLVTIVCQTEKWSLRTGGHLVHVEYGENAMNGSHWQQFLLAGGLLKQVVI